MKKYRSFADVEESYFRDHPEEMGKLGTVPVFPPIVATRMVWGMLA